MAELLEVSGKFYDCTWEDFQDKDLLKELKEKKVFSGLDIKELIAFKEAFAIRVYKSYQNST